MNGYGRGDEQQKKEGKTSVITRETIGMTLLLFSAVALFISITGKYIFGSIGVSINAFLLGLLGYLVYPVLILLIYVSVILVFGKKLIPAKWLLLGAALVLSIFMLVHLSLGERFYGDGYGSYLSGCWNAANESAAEATGGGVILGLIVYPFRFILSLAGAYVIFSALLLTVAFLIFHATPLWGKLAVKHSGRRERAKVRNDQKTDGVREYPAPVAFDDLPSSRPEQPMELRDASVRESRAFEQQNAQYPTQQGYPVSQQGAQYPTQQGYPVSQQGAQYPTQQGYPVSQRGAQYPTQQGYPVSQQGAQYPTQQGYPVSQRGAQYPTQQGYPISQRGAQPTRQQTARSNPPATSGQYSQSRDILYRSDPAKNYRDNLIFDQDSYFNSKPIRSNVVLNHDDAASQPASTSTASTSSSSVRASQSYLDGYSRQAEESRAAMPRKITGIDADEDVNYPRVPSYRAPETDVERSQDDYYTHDVPYEAAIAEDETSDEPTVPVQAESVETEAPAEPIYSAEQEAAPARRKPARERKKPKPEPQESGPSVAERAFDAFDRRTLRDDAPEEEEPRERDSEFRDLFSRRSEEETPFAESSEGIDGIPLRRDPLSRGVSEETDDTPLRRDPLSRGVSEETDDTPLRRDPLSRGVSEETDDAPLRRDPLSRGVPEETDSRVFQAPMRDSASSLFDADDVEETDGDYEEALPPSRSFGRGSNSAVAPVPKAHIYRAYVRPPLDLFRHYDDSVIVPQEEIERNSNIIIETLAGFRVDAEIIKVKCGSSVTRYDIDIPRNISVGTVVKRDEEIAMRLHARDGVNMYANRERGAISIEVPNSKRATVGVKSILDSNEFQNADDGSLMFVMGKDIEGRNVCGNIDKMKHILVAGATGSGKSVCLNAMLISLISRYSPADLRLILIDPKKVEFAIYDGLPHLMINEIIADAQRAVTALNWTIKEMERRYQLFEQTTRGGKLVHNLKEYNESLTDDDEKLPKILVVIDELADLMSVAKKDIEERIQRISQKARAAGIHLVIATQRPSVDVITGVIKGNLPTRLAFRVIQEVDSRTILDESGAEKLLGNGDMLYRTEGMFDCSRVQGAFLSADEVQSVVEFIKSNNEAYFDEEITDYINNTNQSEYGGSEDFDSEKVDPLYIKALAIVVKLGTASISLIQRKCSVGYNHAGKIMEWMEVMNYVSPFDGKSKARTVLMTKEEFESKYGGLD